MSPEAQATLQEIVAIDRDGKEFYEYAEMVVADPALRARFGRLARAKSEIVALTAGRLPPRPLSDGIERRQFRHGVHETLNRLRGELATQDGTQVLAELEDLEERLVHHYSWLLAGTGDQATRRELCNLLPVMQRCRDELAGPTPATAG